ncbi:MAG: hypothetical protein COX30_01290 [Candidatus Moranbacteria bacterium CG23_combo_of_CG06-09_8_20_14_all_39_10]|nr:MAG: hypothetical protein COX30_01290 [Candidatus Moranbacteria bacterium CG23_combo_of_CG06-09_8_20_14_all_39_10]
MTKKKSKSLFHRLAHFHIKMASFLLIFYLMLGMLIDPRFLAYDFRQKYFALASSSNITVSLRVMGEPEKPILIAEAGWENGVNFIDLSWNETEDTETYDIYRNAFPLITGITENSYRDTNIEKNTFYDYKVLAKGPLGTTFSDEIHIFSGDYEIYKEPFCQINTIANKTFTGTPKITERLPIFSGTTNIANALIEIKISGEKNINATTLANSNGYWSFYVPEKLDYGTYHILISAIDPENSLVFAQTNRSFEIIKEEEEKKTVSTEKPLKETTVSPITSTPTEKNIPEKLTEEPKIILEKDSFQILVSIENKNKQLYADDYLIVNTKIIPSLSDFENKAILLRYTVLDEKNNSVLDFSENSLLTKTIQKKIYISNLVPAGKYKIIVRANNDNRLIIGEDFFEVREYYLINIGSLHISLTQIMQSISWIIFLLFLFILFFLLMLVLEKYLSSQARRQITEYFLAQRGFLGKRKEVQK